MNFKYMPYSDELANMILNHKDTNNKFYEINISEFANVIGSRQSNVQRGISTSGNSKNVIEAFKIAKEKGIKTVAFVGKNGGELRKISDIILDVPSDITNNIQELHIIAGHIICEIVEEYFYRNL